MDEKSSTKKTRRKKKASTKGNTKDNAGIRKEKILTPDIINDTFSEFDKRALVAVKNDPEKSNRRISMDVSETGSPQYLYARLQTNQYLSLAIEQIRSSHAEQLSRVITPKALQELEDALDDKDLSRKEKGFYVKLALDKEPKFADRRDATVPPRINIEQIQILIKGSLGSENYEIKEGVIIEEEG